MTKVRSYKPEAYEQAINFRRRGFTYTEIAKICNVSRGTVSNWLRHKAFSKAIAETNKKQAVIQNKKRLALINKARLAERKQQSNEIERLAAIEYKNYRTIPAFVAGLALYMTIGDAHNHRLIRLSDSRPEIHRLFINFLITYVGVAKNSIRFWLLLYPDLDEATCMKQWSKKISLSPALFYKNQVIPSRSQTKTLHFGVGNTIIASTLLKKKLQKWVNLLKNEVK